MASTTRVRRRVRRGGRRPFRVRAHTPRAPCREAGEITSSDRARVRDGWNARITRARSACVSGVAVDAASRSGDSHIGRDRASPGRLGRTAMLAPFWHLFWHCLFRSFCPSPVTLHTMQSEILALLALLAYFLRSTPVGLIANAAAHLRCAFFFDKNFFFEKKVPKVPKVPSLSCSHVRIHRRPSGQNMPSLLPNVPRRSGGEGGDGAGKEPRLLFLAQ